MRKSVLLFVIAALFTNSIKAQEKAFQKGKISISIGAGLGVYKTHPHQEQDQSVYSGGSIHTVRTIKDTTDGAASGIFPLTIEYGVTNWLGLGAKFGYASYIAHADSTNNNTKPTVRGIDADLVASLHFIKTVHFDMPVEFACGYSNLKYLSNDRNASAAKGAGINYMVSLVPRIYFGKHLGMFFNVGYAGFTYPNMIFYNNTNSNLNADSGNLTYRLKAGGINIGFGLVVKFH